MLHAMAVGLVGLVAIGATGPASAQADTVIGQWSGSSFGPDGARRFAMTLEVDDSFVSVLSLPNGTTQRVWGKYRASRLSPTEMTIDFTTQGWLPYQTCVKGIGRIPHCTPYRPILATPVTLKFTNPLSARTEAMSFKVDGDTWYREPTKPALLTRIVPDHLMLSSTTGPTVFGQPAPRKYSIPP